MPSDTIATRETVLTSDTQGRDRMAKKKSEKRRHTGILRINSDVLLKAKKAASLMEMTLADYATDVLSKAAEKDLKREGGKLAGGTKP